MQCGVHILVDVAMKFVSETHMELSEQEISSLRSSFLHLITRRITREQARKNILSICKNCEPFMRICNILDTEFHPIPEAPESKKSEGIGTRKKTRTWSINEDNRLYMAICLYGQENWNKIAMFVGNGRLRNQCSQRWIRVLDPKIVKSSWTQEEDRLLLYLVSLLGDKSWVRISNQIGTRSDVQCRYRYQQLQREMKETPKGESFIDENSCQDEKLKVKSMTVQELPIPLSEQVTSLTGSFGVFDSAVWLS